MQTLLFILAWIIAAAAVVLFAFSATRAAGDGEKFKPLGRVPTPVRLLIALVALAAVVGMPVAVTAATGDRVPGNAGAFTEDSSRQLREGREIFSGTCASCHALSAAGARGVYGPNLDSIGLGGKGGSTRVIAAIANGGAAGMQMPKALLEGEDAKLVADYIAAVAAK